jgi:ketosteroid isomerase-like protein
MTFPSTGARGDEHYLESVSSDQQAIIDVAIAYTYALDTKQFDDLKEVFAADATADLHGVRCDGREAIIARIERPISMLDATQHLVGNHQVHVDGATATHRCYLQSQHVKRGTPGGENYLIGGVYEDRLARTPDGWRITHRTMTPSGPTATQR